MSTRHLIAYAIIFLALVGIVLVILRSRRRRVHHYERIDITRDEPRQ